MPRRPATLALALSSVILSKAMQPAQSAAFVPVPLACSHYQVPGCHRPTLGHKPRTFHLSDRVAAKWAVPLLGALATFPFVVPQRSRQRAVGRSMAMKDWDDTDGNKTDIYSNVGAAGNLRSPGKGFKTPEVAPRVDRANFDVKPENSDSDETPFEEKQKMANFGDLVEFPCKFQIKIVGARQGEFLEDILDSIGNVVKVDRAGLPHTFRDKGKWRSITVRVPVESAEQLYEVYAAIDKDPRVQFKF